jgi:hypothetical protein
MKWFLTSVVVVLCVGCHDPIRTTSDQKQQAQQEIILQEATSEIGMPAIKNFRERKILKDIYELRDQIGLVTYTYLENQIPGVVAGKTALGGKLTFLGESIGYGISASTQFTNPQKIEWGQYRDGGWYKDVLPQADPNGLFSPSSAEGTWVMILNPKTHRAEPQYVEPRCVVLTFQLPTD